MLEASSEDAVTCAGLFPEHEIKQEIVVGPEVIQPPDLVFTLRDHGAKLPTVKHEYSDDETDSSNGSYPSSECSGEYIKEEPVCSENREHVLKPCSVLLERIGTESELKILHKSMFDVDKFTSKVSNAIGTEHTIKDEEFICDSCSRSFTVKEKLISHLQSYSKKCKRKVAKRLRNTKVFFCNECMRGFAQKPNLIRHMQTVHKQCEICDGYSHANCLHRTEKKPAHKCSVCSKEVKAYSLLLRHMQTHLHEKPYPCKICNKRLANSYNLKMHMLIHSGDKRYSCDICQKRFRHRSNWNDHKKIHGDKHHECEICHKRFSIGYALKLHKVRHTDERPFSCDVCHMSFKCRSSLNAHKRRIHSTKYRYSCEFCHQEFKYHAAFDNHRRIHTKEPYSCSECKEQFPGPTALVKHKRANHKSRWRRVSKASVAN